MQSPIMMTVLKTVKSKRIFNFDIGLFQKQDVFFY